MKRMNFPGRKNLRRKEALGRLLKYQQRTVVVTRANELAYERREAHIQHLRELTA